MARTSAVVGTPVLLSLGSNLGDRCAQLARAVDAIARCSLLEELVCSPIYETEPVGYTDQPLFLNCCIAGRTALDPQNLHYRLKELERSLGRRRRPRWHEREIDIDIILFGTDIITGTDLVIPHPHATERAFVLIPARDIAADWIHPVAGKTIADLAALVDGHSVRKTDFCITVPHAYRAQR